MLRNSLKTLKFDGTFLVFDVTFLVFDVTVLMFWCSWKKVLANSQAADNVHLRTKLQVKYIRPVIRILL